MFFCWKLRPNALFLSSWSCCCFNIREINLWRYHEFSQSAFKEHCILQWTFPAHIFCLFLRLVRADPFLQHHYFILWKKTLSVSYIFFLSYLLVNLVNTQLLCARVKIVVIKSKSVACWNILLLRRCFYDIADNYVLKSHICIIYCLYFFFCIWYCVTL